MHENMLLLLLLLLGTKAEVRPSSSNGNRALTSNKECYHDDVHIFSSENYYKFQIAFAVTTTDCSHSPLNDFMLINRYINYQQYIHAYHIHWRAHMHARTHRSGDVNDFWKNFD